MHILLITRHYPPNISGGARRPWLYTKALRQLGHRVTLVTPFPTEDPDHLHVPSAQINRGVRHLHASNKSKKPKLLNRLKNAARPWVYWPDDNIRWAREVVAAVRAFAQTTDFRPDWIMTTNPPESVHVAGAALSRILDTHWLAEFRDTWVENPHREILSRSKLRAVIEQGIARRTLCEADAVTAVSEAVMGEARRYVKPGTPNSIIGHFSTTFDRQYDFDNSRLNLVHTGGFSLSDRRRALKPLLEILDKISRERSNLTFHIAGPLSAEEIDMISTANTDVKWHKTVSIEDSRALQCGADGLVLYTPENSHALPGKYAEYVLSGRPILYMGGGGWLDLVEDPRILRPLAAGGLNLRKNEKIIPKDVLTNIQAAEMLIAFLQSCDRKIAAE